MYKNDDELFNLLENELFTAVVGDIMDKMGFLNQFLPPNIASIATGQKISGRAMTVLESDVLDYDKDNTSHNPLLQKPFGLMLEALDDLKTGEIYVASGSASDYALVGELMATRAKKLGARGFVVNGYVRDIDGINAIGVPCFCTGAYAKDQAPRGKIMDYRVPITFGSVVIESGDLLFGDGEGVLVIPRQAEKEIIEKSLEKARGEKKVATAIQSGMSACEAFEKFGIM